MNPIEKYKKAWQSALDQKTINILKILSAFVEVDAENGKVNYKTYSFSELLKKTKMSSRTLNRWLKLLIRGHIITKEKEKTFPWESRYKLAEERPVRLLASTIASYDGYYQHLIIGAVKRYEKPRILIEKALKHANLYDLYLNIDPSWLEDEPSRFFLEVLFNALNAITFWGTFYIMREFPEEAKKLLKEKGLYSSTEKELFAQVFKL